MKILVIEDEPRVAKNIKKGLELNSMVVDIALDGNTGLDLALAEKYDTMIIDRMLPGLDGLSICQKIRENKISTPILLLTARSETDDIVDGLSCGADDYLTKPFEFAELIARVKALGRRQQSEVSNILKEADLLVDLTNFSVHRSHLNIDLSPKEYALLEFLIRHKHQVFSPEQLTTQVWNFDSDVLPNTAQVYIGYLRSKIDKAFPNSKPLIHTVRGFGYKFGEIK